MAFLQTAARSSVHMLKAWSRVRPAAALWLGAVKQPHYLCVHHQGQRYYSEKLDTKDSSGELVPERLYNKVNIKVKGNDFTVLESYCRFVITAGKVLDINIGGRVALPTRIQKFTVLKSPHIFKKHRVQYEIRTHSRLMQVKEITGTTCDIFLEYIQRNLPEGVSMSVYQERLDTLPLLVTGPPEGEEPEEKTTTKPKNKKAFQKNK